VKTSPSQNARLGLFLVLAGVLFVVGLGVIARTALFSKRVAYHLYFDDSVSGLDEGAPVRVRGVARGTVTELSIDPETTRVHAVIELSPETPLHTDAEARLGFLGVTGLRYVEVSPGSPAMPRLPPGSTLPAKAGTFEALSGDLEGVIEETERLLTNVNALIGPGNRERLNALIDSVTRSLNALSEIARDNSTGVRAVLERAAASLETLNRLGEAALPAVRRAEGLLAHLDAAVTEVPIARIGRNLDETVAAVRRIATDPELQRAGDALAEAAAHLAGTLDRADAGVVRGVHESLTLLATLQRASRELELLLRQVRSQPTMLLRGRPEVKP
jgi:phospholipid/cholesterol/gamma-HCH transport system substrate-binding protein